MDRRIDYRTVYAAMCSQAHHDAEDILNHFLVNTMITKDDFSGRLEIETDTFSLFMVLFGLRWFVECMIAVGKCLKFDSVSTEATKSLDRIDAELHAVAAHLDTGKRPQNWLIK